MCTNYNTRSASADYTILLIISNSDNYDKHNKIPRTRKDAKEHLITPIYNVLKKQHEADVDKAITFMSDGTRKFLDIEDVLFQFKKYMEE